MNALVKFLPATLLVPIILFIIGICSLAKGKIGADAEAETRGVTCIAFSLVGGIALAAITGIAVSSL